MGAILYTFTSEDSLKFDILEEYENVKFYYSSDLSKNAFVYLHNKSLLSNEKDIKCILNVEKIDTSILLKILQASVVVNVIWCFNKLDKRTKLYKYIKENFKVKESKELNNLKDKNLFIKKYLKRYNLPEKYLERINFSIIGDKFAIKTEIEKISLISKLGINKADELLSTYISEQDLFEFVSNFISNTDRAYLYAIKFKDLNIDYMFKDFIFNLLNKKIRSYIYLSIDKIEVAKKFWNTNNYYLDKEVSIAKKFGYNNFLKLYKLLKTLFLNYNENESLYYKLCYLIDFIMDVKNESSYSRHQNF